ncbi:hypothetical protein VTO73DRAFT_9484 [Trametes versicolor]
MASQLLIPDLVCNFRQSSRRLGHLLYTKSAFRLDIAIGKLHSTGSSFHLWTGAGCTRSKAQDLPSSSIRCRDAQDGFPALTVLDQLVSRRGFFARVEPLRNPIPFKLQTLTKPPLDDSLRTEVQSTTAAKWTLARDSTYGDSGSLLSLVQTAADSPSRDTCYVRLGRLGTVPYSADPLLRTRAMVTPSSGLAPLSVRYTAPPQACVTQL